MWQHSYLLLNYWQVSKESDKMNGNFIQRRKGDRRIYMLKKKHTLLIYTFFLKSYSQEICSVQFNSVAQSCSPLFEPIDCTTPGFPVHHQLLEFTQTHVHWVGNTIQPSSSVIPFSACLQYFPASGSFQMSQFFSSGGKIIAVSASAWVLPMNIQDWFPLGLTDWMALLSKGLLIVFSNIIVQKHQFFNSQLSFWSNSHIHTWPQEKP